MGRVLDAPIIVNDQSLERLLSVGIPVLILLWNGQDLPGDLDQTLLKLARDEAGKLLIAKINIRENTGAAHRFNAVKSPVLVFIKQRSEISRLESPSVPDVLEHVRHLLGRGPQPRQKPAGVHAESSPGHPIKVTDASFEQQVLRSELPVLVDFWAPWCGPCHMIAPALEKIAADFAGRLVVAKLNVDENPITAGRYSIQGIPTLLVIRGGVVLNRLVDALPEPHLRAEVERVLRMS
jgi:thioredoxin 1